MSALQTQIPRRWNWLGPALIVIAVIVLYAPTLHAPFIFDDIGSIAENPTIRSLSDWQAILATRAQETVAGRPVVNATLALNYALGGYDVRGYHLFNITVFLVSCHTLWAILRLAAASVLAGRWPPTVDASASDNEHRAAAIAPWLASAVVLVWAVHPLQSETVTYIVQRTELMKTMFYLSTLYASMRWMMTPRGKWLALAFMSCALGMACKESMVSAPLMVLVFDRLFVEKGWASALKKHRTLYIALALSWLVLFALAIGAPRSNTAGFGLGVSSLEYLQTQAHVLVHYLRLCVWPTNLTVAYDWPIEHSFTNAIPAGLAIVALLAFTIWLLKRGHWLAAPWAMFFLVLGPTSSFVPIVSEVAAERRMHLPLLAVILTLVAVVAKAFTWRGARSPESRPIAVMTIALALLTAGPLAFATAARLTDYKDELTIWTSALKARAGFPTPTANQYIAQYYANRGMYEQALPYILENTRLVPGNSIIEDIAGRLLLRTGRPAEAIPHYRIVVENHRAVRGSYLPQLNLARALKAAGQSVEAIAIIQNLLSDPAVPQQAVATELELDAAVDRAREQLAANPRDAAAQTALGLALARHGNLREAITHFNAALAIDPTRTDARDYLMHAQKLLEPGE